MALGPSSAVLSWTGPASDGGQPVTQYEVTVTDGQSTIFSQTVTATTVRLTGLSVDSLYTASVVAVNAVGRSDPASTSFRPQNGAPSLTVPDTQTVPYGHALSFAVTATDPDPADHLTISAAGLPAGLTLNDRGDGTASVSGSVAAPAGTYLVTVSVGDGHNGAVTQTMRIIVVQESATVALSAANPTTVKLAANRTVSGTVALRATVAAGAGDLKNATPVTYVLTGMRRGVTYTRTAVLTSGQAAGSVDAAVQLRGLPVDAYHVQISVGGYYYGGAAEGFLTVYKVQRNAVQACGTIARDGKQSSLTLNARYLSNGRISGQLAYSQGDGAVSLKSASLGAMIVAGSRSYIQGAGLDSSGRRVRFVLTLVRGGSGQAGLQVIDASGAAAQDLSFDLQPFTSGRISIS